MKAFPCLAALLALTIALSLPQAARSQALPDTEPALPGPVPVLQEEPLPELPNGTICVPGLVKCSAEGNYMCTADGMSWNPCTGNCSGICPRTYRLNTTIDEYIREINQRLNPPEEGYGFFGRMEGYVAYALEGKANYELALGGFAIALAALLIYWRRMEG